MPATTTLPEVAPNTRVQPDPDKCQTAPLEIGIHWGACLVSDPADCRFVKNYGGAHHICKHPNWYEFIRQ